jgi:phosphate transport system substrate-binding protein
MVNLGQAWAEEFMRLHPEVSIAVTGGGSGTGIAALINGTTNIAQCSREMKPEEKKEVLKSTGKEVKEFKVGLDALAVILHPANSVSELSIDQLSDIFTGKVKNWKEVGGFDEPILVLSRERNSGTHVYFLEEVLRKGNHKGPEEFASSVLMMPSSQAIAQEVARSRAAIGYLGLGYVAKEHKVAAVKRSAADAAVLPSVEAAQNKIYPISRFLYIYTAGEPEGQLKQFLDFIQSADGQSIVALMDFVPLEKHVIPADAGIQSVDSRYPPKDGSAIFVAEKHAGMTIDRFPEHAPSSLFSTRKKDANKQAPEIKSYKKDAGANKNQKR